METVPCRLEILVADLAEFLRLESNSLFIPWIHLWGYCWDEGEVLLKVKTMLNSLYYWIYLLEFFWP